MSKRKVALIAAVPCLIAVAAVGFVAYTIHSLGRISEAISNFEDEPDGEVEVLQ